jgi:hypothetical protein
VRFRNATFMNLWDRNVAFLDFREPATPSDDPRRS